MHSVINSGISGSINEETETMTDVNMQPQDTYVPSGVTMGSAEVKCVNCDEMNSWGVDDCNRCGEDVSGFANGLD